MTLCQYYDQYAIELGYRSWNHYCAEIQIPHREHMKKVLKREYKNAKKENDEVEVQEALQTCESRSSEEQT